MDMDRLPETPKDRGAWPEKPDMLRLDDPVEVTVLLERPVYEWLAGYLDKNADSFLSNVGESFSTFIRAMANDGLDLEFVQSIVAAGEPQGKINWPESNGPQLGPGDDDFPF